MSSIKEAKRVFSLQAEILNEISELVDSTFEESIETLNKSKMTKIYPGKKGSFVKKIWFFLLNDLSYVGSHILNPCNFKFLSAFFSCLTFVCIT